MLRSCWRYAYGGLLCAVLVACTGEDRQVVAPIGSDGGNQSAAARAAEVPPTPTFVPVGGGEPDRRPPALSSASGTTVELDDAAWQGGYNRSNGSNVYGGRTAMWIYGTATQYNTMTARFEVVGQPFDTAELRIEGMDSEDAAKTPIQITINGTEIYNDVNPLPNDDQPLDSGTWESSLWSFSASLLQPGTNVVEIKNLARGAFGLPPFFMLDFAEISYQAQ